MMGDRQIWSLESSVFNTTLTTGMDCETEATLGLTASWHCSIAQFRR